MSDRKDSIEKVDEGGSVSITELRNDIAPSSRLDRLALKSSEWLAKQGLEGHGIAPVPREQRTDPRLYQIFFTWFAANANILAFGAGSIGPAVYGLGIRDSFLTIVVTDIITCAFPAFFAVFGPKMGTRAMVQGRFSWGYYATILPSILNVLSMQGYLIINCIIGGQTLASSSSHLSSATGIIITGLISLAVNFCGYQILHWYEIISWVPNVISFAVMCGVGGKTLASIPISSSVTPRPSDFFSFGTTLAATVISWSTITPDQGIFHDSRPSTTRIFVYAYLGFLVASIPAHMLGAVFTAGAVYVPSWNAGLGNGNDVGGLIAAVLAPAGGFGKFLLVLLALTTPSASAPTMYTVCTSFMTISKVFARIPRFVFAIISTAILIPVGVVGATHFYATFTEILSFIGYWIAPYMGIVLTEHFVFRRTWAAYEPEEAWDKPRHPNLPRGYAAMFTFLTSIPLIVICMSQTWYTGPVALAGTGDIAMIVSFIYAVAVFSVVRRMEMRWTGRSDLKLL